MSIDIWTDSMQHAELFGKPVLFTNWLRDGSVPQTIAVPDGTRLTRLFGLRATSAFIIAIAVGLIVYYFPVSYTHLTLPTTSRV